PSASASFTYDTDSHGDGSYDFYSKAYDNAGNVEATPLQPDDVTVMSDSSTLLDQSPPTSTASVPEYETTTTFNVGYPATDFGSPPSGLDHVDLYVQGPLDPTPVGPYPTDSGAGIDNMFSHPANEGAGQ